MPEITPALSAPDPVTFDENGIGSVHAYGGDFRPHMPLAITACGILLAGDHATVPPSDTTPLCPDCWA